MDLRTAFQNIKESRLSEGKVEGADIVYTKTITTKISKESLELEKKQLEAKLKLVDDKLKLFKA